MDILVAILICSLVAYIGGYLRAEHNWMNRLESELNSFNDILESNTSEFKDNLRETRNVYEVKIRELKNEHSKLLNEISHATGVDEINLPSFGTIYLDSEKHLREAMRLLNEED